MVRNPDYWKPGRPYLDGIEYTIIVSPATWQLAFAAGKLDFIFATIPLLKEVKAQAPHSVCDIVMDNNSRDLVINRTAPPFDMPEVRRAIALSLDRQAFLDILVEREGAVGGAMLPPPDGVWGMTQDVLRTLPGYGPDVARNREEARALMRQAGLWAGPPACDQAVDPQHTGLPRRGGHRRIAFARNLYRRRA